MEREDIVGVSGILNLLFHFFCGAYTNTLALHTICMRIMVHYFSKTLFLFFFSRILLSLSLSSFLSFVSIFFSLYLVLLVQRDI